MANRYKLIQIIKMKITTKKIILELEKIGWELEPAQELLVIRVRDIIDEILKEQKGITIKK